MQSAFRRDVRRVILVVLGSILYAFNINTFVNAAGRYPSGFSGLSLLLQTVLERYAGLHVPYTVFNLLLNAVPVVVSFRFIGRKFTLLSCLAIVLMSILTDVMPGMDMTSDPLLLSVFGGLLFGVAVSLCLLADATSGGMDFISIYLSEQHGRDSFNLILGFNVVMLAAAGLLFGWEKALYSIIFQYVGTQVLHVLYKRYQQQTLMIVTDRADEVCRIISDITHHGSTLLHGIGAYEQAERTLVYSVVSADEVNRVIASVRAADPEAFINSIKTTAVSGRFYRQPND